MSCLGQRLGLALTTLPRLASTACNLSVCCDQTTPCRSGRATSRPTCVAGDTSTLARRCTGDVIAHLHRDDPTDRHTTTRTLLTTPQVALRAAPRALPRLLCAGLTNLCSASYICVGRDTARIFCRTPCCCAPCCCDDPRPPLHVNQYLRGHSSKPAARCCSGR